MKHWIIALLTAASGLAAAQTAPLRLRATIEQADATRITVRERSGEVVTLALADNLVVTEVQPISMQAIQPGAFIGTAALPLPDGTLQALEVHVFPESGRGTGEGHRPFDLQPGSTMTNATIADLVGTPQGRRLTLRYKDGEKTVLVPDGTPIITFKPGERSLLVVGAKVTITAELREGKPTALRVLAGRDGFVPPL